MSEEKRGPGRPPKAEQMKTVRLLRGYWPEGAEKKAEAGSVLDLPSDEAKRVCTEIKAGELFDRAWTDAD